MLRLSGGERAAGGIKTNAEDFVVEEITTSGVILSRDMVHSAEELKESVAGPESKFTRFVLQKTDWNTASALREVTKRVGRGIKSAGFAGSKDRTSISTQLCSIYGASPEQLLSINAKDIKINGAWRGDKQVGLGDLLGNRFTLTLRDTKDTDRIGHIGKELNGLFPNYYGSQRFGIRDNNFDVGLAIMKGDFEAAVLRFLTDSTNERNQEAVEARKRLFAERDFGAALGYFPRYLKSERLVLQYLSMNPTDFGNAIRKLPRAITLMFVHSVESRIFNMELEMRIKNGRLKAEMGDLVCASDFYGFPDLETVRPFDGGKYSFLVGNIVGYDTAELTVEEKELLEQIGISKEDFRVKRMPELNCKGTFRPLFAPYNDFHFSEGGGVMSFSLPSGSYATVLASEFLETDSII
jgi:tRNA pseudouridine13 synthase